MTEQNDPRVWWLVVNIKNNPHFDRFVGRGSEFGNPYTHLPLSKTRASIKVSNVKEAVRRFEDEYLPAHPELVEKIKMELKGKVLGCYCKGRHPVCHAYVLAKIANDL